MQISNQLINTLFGDSLAASNSQNQYTDKNAGKNSNDFEDVFTNSINTLQTADAVKPSSNYDKFTEKTKLSNNSYADLASGGFITYNGVTFSCGDNTLSLGDVSNKNNVLMIQLSGGVSLMVNRDNLGDLAKAIGMFSPQDTKRILDAIAIDAKTKSKDTEINDTINKVYETISEE